VLQVFRRQLQSGQALTVTHPDTTRYFMTIPEAVQLILQASLLPELRGHIAMLEMGEPIRIAEMAHNLLCLAGVSNPAERVVYTGLRPGEKLHEELCGPDEESRPTDVPKVRILSTPSLTALAAHVRMQDWDAAVRNGQDEVMLNSFFELFPGLSRPVAADAGAPRTVHLAAEPSRLRA
jgi:FlaA1/EpsC-like NDP-sugar epimerase